MFSPKRAGFFVNQRTKAEEKCMSEMISIIVPVFNVEEYLEECLDSIIKQTYKQIQVIMVDDGSTDLSGRICDNYSRLDSRFKVIHKKNGGVSSARNVGLDAAEGEYIGFVDPDDWIDVDMYDRLLYNICKYNVDISVCAYYEHRRSEVCVKLYELIGRVKSDEALSDLLQHFNAYLWCRLYRRQVFEGMRFIEGRNFEDVEIMPRLFMNSSWVYFDTEPMYHYRLMRYSSIVSNRSCENLKDYFFSYIDILKNIKKEKTEFAGQAVKGAVIGYLEQCKRLSDIPKITQIQKEELCFFKSVLLKEMGGIHQKKGLSLKLQWEFMMALYFPALFIKFCRWYRMLIGRSLG